MKYFAFILFFLLASAASAQAPTAELFKGFVSMNVPQSTLPIGARWIPSVGPTGPAADAGNVTRSESVSSAILTTSTKKSMTFSLATFLGLSGNAQASMQAQFGGLAIDRVANLTAIKGVNSGDQLLFSGLRAGTISILIDKGSAADFQAAAEAKGLNVTLGVSSGNDTHFEIKGSNLYFAYQVLGLGAPKVRQVTLSHDGNEATVDATYRFRFCSCAPGSPLVIEVQNLKSVGLDGQYVTRKINHNPATQYLNEYSLDPHYSGANITAGRVKFKYLARQHCSPLGAMTKDGQPVRLCGEVSFPKKENNITVTLTTFKLSLVNPGSIL